jgi:hypothetical protein
LKALGLEFKPQYLKKKKKKKTGGDFIVIIPYMCTEMLNKVTPPSYSHSPILLPPLSNIDWS